MEFVQLPMVLLLGNLVEKCLRFFQRVELPALERLAQGFGHACRAMAGCRAVLLAQAAVLEFLSAAAGAGIIATDGRCFHLQSAQS